MCFHGEAALASRWQVEMARDAEEDEDSAQRKQDAVRSGS